MTVVMILEKQTMQRRGEGRTDHERNEAEIKEIVGVLGTAEHREDQHTNTPVLAKVVENT